VTEDSGHRNDGPEEDVFQFALKKRTAPAGLVSERLHLSSQVGIGERLTNSENNAGWLPIAYFISSKFLTFAAASSVRQALRHTPGVVIGYSFPISCISRWSTGQEVEDGDAKKSVPRLRR
jgi:hypothetical protein